METTSATSVVPVVAGLPEALRVDRGGATFEPISSYFLLQLMSTLVRQTPVRYEGLEQVPTEGPVILAANHLAHLDPVYIIAGVRRRVHYLAKQEHFNRPGVNVVMRMSGQINTDRSHGGGDALAMASAVLEQGSVLGIFPEGTRSRRQEPPFLARGKTGVARLAASHPDVPVHPIALQGTRAVMTPKVHKVPRLWRRVTVRIGAGMSWRQWLAHPGRSEVLEAYDKVLEAGEAPEARAGLAAIQRRFTDELMASIRHLGAP